jgi:hypothetical protein
MKKKFLFTVLIHLWMFSLITVSLSAQTVSKWSGSQVKSETVQPMKIRGFFSLTELNLGLGLSDVSIAYAERFAGISTVAGFHFGPAVWTGLGIGISRYNGGTLLPLFFDGRYYFGESRAKPFIMADAGILFHSGGEESGTRIFGNPGVGVRLPVGLHASFSLALGLFTQWEMKTNRDSFINGKIGLVIH